MSLDNRKFILEIHDRLDPDKDWEIETQVMTAAELAELDWTGRLMDFPRNYIYRFYAEVHLGRCKKFIIRDWEEDA